MRWMPLSLFVVGMLAGTLAAAEAPAPVAPSPSATVNTNQPSPELVRLDALLAKTQQDRAQGRLTIEKYGEFVVKFKGDLETANEKASSSAVNATLYARILARLVDSNQVRSALHQNSAGLDANLALSKRYFNERTSPSVLAGENAILKTEPFTGQRRDDSIIVDLTSQASRENRNRFASVDPANLPFKLPVSIAPAAAPPDLIRADEPLKRSAPLPLLPLAGAIGLGAAAYGVSKSRDAYVSEDGLDAAHPVEPGPYQRLVAGTILAGVAGGVIYLAGAAALTAATPALLRYAEPVVNQGLRLAGSEVGAINPSEVRATNEIPTMLARVIPLPPDTEFPPMIGKIGEPRAFVTASEDIAGLDAIQLARRLGIKPAREFLIIRFPTPATGLSTPLQFDHPEFIGRGLTSGGAREFFIENATIPREATYEVVK